MSARGFDDIIFEAPPRRRRLCQRFSHIIPAIGIAAGIGMWLGAVVWLLVRIVQ